MKLDQLRLAQFAKSLAGTKKETERAAKAEENYGKNHSSDGSGEN